MGTGFCSNDNQQKIRSKFNIEESYCAIKTKEGANKSLI